MSEHNFKTYSSKDLEAMRQKGEGQTNWERLDAMRDEEIDFSEIPEPDDEAWNSAKIVFPELTEPVTLQIDQETLTFFQKETSNYQARMQAVLQAYAKSIKRARNQIP